ncbi:MAG: ATP-dependent DNA helicase [Micrococcaceae bacterium]
MSKTLHQVTPEQIADAMGKPHPTDEQCAVITAELQPQLVVAGAGSGKTETMSSRVLWLIANGIVNPQEILGVTFTKKAATELSERIFTGIAALQEAHLMPKNFEFAAPTVSTYHSYAQALVNEYGFTLGVEGPTEPMGATESWSLVKKLVEDYPGDAQNITSALSSLCRYIITFSGQCAEHLIEPADVISFLQEQIAYFEALPEAPEGKRPRMKDKTDYLFPLKERIVVAEIAQKFEDEKRIQGLVDFGDLIKLAAEIAINVKQAGEDQREKYKVVLLDEFQDTSFAQMELFEKLFGTEHAITAVGDPNQSIYGWRGASSGGMGRFAQNFVSKKYGRVPVSNLSTSWRNQTKILDAANKIVKPLATYGLDIAELESKPQSEQGNVKQARFETNAEESESIADFIEAKWNNKDTIRPAIAILCRKKSFYAEIEKALNARDIPCQILGLAGLLDTPEVIDLVSMLQAIDNPDEPEAIMRILMGARWQLGARDLKELKVLAQALQEESYKKRTSTENSQYIPETLDEYSLIDAIDALRTIDEDFVVKASKLSKEGYQRLKALAQHLAQLRTLQYLELPDFVYRVVKSMYLDLELKVVAQNSKIAMRHIHEFLNVSKEYFRRDAGSLSDFLSWLEIAKEQENGLEMPEPEANRDAVQLTTVHSAKGLEWDIVIIPQLSEGSFPDTPRATDWISDKGAVPWPLRGDAKDLPQWDPSTQSDQKSLVDSYLEHLKEPSKDHFYQEERRLAYVAFTRAKEFLLLTTSVYTGTTKKKREVSRFLDEICLSDADTLHWVTNEEAEEENPALDAEILVSQWPYDALGSRRQAINEAVELIKKYQGTSDTSFSDPHISTLFQNYETLRKKQAQDRPTNNIPLPSRLSASQIVELSSKPEELAARLRRPMPFKPNPRAKRGNSFHEWAQHYFEKAGDSLFDDVQELEEPAAADLEELIAIFENSEWAQKQAVAVEAPIELSLEDVTIPGRIDAIFKDQDGYTLVDWKTGVMPEGKNMESASLQLAIYRLAYAQLHNIDVNKIKACFYYINDNHAEYRDELASREELEQIVRNALS